MFYSNGEGGFFIPRSYSGLKIKWSSVMRVFILRKDMILLSFFLVPCMCVWWEGVGRKGSGREMFVRSFQH